MTRPKECVPDYFQSDDRLSEGAAVGAGSLGARSHYPEPVCGQPLGLRNGRGGL
jgi:hypothetical protein